jgi:hypothetical protein
MPISRSSPIAATASGLPLERGGSSAVGRGRARLDLDLEPSQSPIQQATTTPWR